MRKGQTILLYNQTMPVEATINSTSISAAYELFTIGCNPGFYTNQDNNKPFPYQPFTKIGAN